METPAFAGVTALDIFYETIKVKDREGVEGPMVVRYHNIIARLVQRMFSSDLTRREWLISSYFLPNFTGDCLWGFRFRGSLLGGSPDSGRELRPESSFQFPISSFKFQVSSFKFRFSSIRENRWKEGDLSKKVFRGSLIY